MFLILYHQLKGLGIQEGSLCLNILCLWCPILGHLQCDHLSLRGLGSLLWHHPPFSESVLRSCHQQAITDEVIWVATMVTALSSCWASFTAWPRHTMNSSVTPLMPSGSLLSMHSSLSALSSSRCATHAEWVMAGWLPLSFHKGKKLITQGLFALAVGGVGRMVPLLPPSQPPMPLGDNPNMSSHYHLLWGMPPSL